MAEKPPPPPNEGKFLTPDLSISGNFKQLWFWWQKPPPPPGWRKYFWHKIYPFQAISSNFGFVGRKATPPMKENFLTPDLSISGNFKQLLFWWQKSPPPQDEGRIFWHQIYPFQAISSNFGFGGRKGPLLPNEGKFLTPDLSISGNFKQLWFCWQKSPTPLRWGKFFLTPDLSISGNFKQLWFWWQKSPPPMRGNFFWHQIYPFWAISSNFGFGGRKAPPPKMRDNFFYTRSIHFRQFQATLVLVAEKPLPPRWGKIFWCQIYPFQAILSNFGFWWQKSHPPPPWDEGNFFDTRSIHFRQFQATLVLVAEKPPSPQWGENFWHQIYPFQAISSNFGFGGRKAPLQWGKFFWHQIYPFQAISSNFGFGGRKPPPPQDEGKFFDTRSIHFRQFQATLVWVAEKPLPPRMKEIFLTQDLSISGNFEQLWFCWQKSHPPPDEGKFFDTRSIHFRQFQATFVLVAEKPPPPKMREVFLTPDLSISGNFKQLWFWWQKSPLPQMKENFLTPDLSISGNFKQLLFWWQKSPPPPQWRKIFWHQIYPFQAILSNFGFGGRKAPPPPRWGKIFLTPDLSISGNFKQLWFWWQKSPPPPNEGKFFDTRSIHFRQFQATLVWVAERRSPPGWRQIFLTQDLSISGNFEQLWFCWQKSHPTSEMRENFLTPDLSISGNFKQLWFWWQKSPPRWGKIFLTPDLAISGNFKQLWFCWQKSHPSSEWGKIFWHQIYPFQAISSNFGFGGRKAPLPPRMMENIFDTRSIHFRQFWATLVLVAEKPPPSEMRENFLTPGSIHFRQFQATLVLVAEKPPPPPMKENFFDTRSIHFRQFQATLVWVAETRSPQDEGNIFWHKIYPFQAILSNFGFVGRKATPLWDEGKFFDTRSIHFRQFQATLVLMAEKPPPSEMRENFLTPDLSISGNFKQLWFWWQKSPPTPKMREIFWHQIYPFQAISSNLVLVAESPPPMREVFLTPDLSISGNFKQLCFGGRKPPPKIKDNFLTPDLSISGISSTLVLVAENPSPQWRKIFDTRSIHFRQFQATLVLVAETPPPPR